MRSVWVFLCIAGAVALGMALAPFVWLILGGALALAAIGGLAYAAWVQRRWVLVAGQIAFGLLLLWWPVWLWRMGSHKDAVFVMAVLVTGAVWGHLRRFAMASTSRLTD